RFGLSAGDERDHRSGLALRAFGSAKDVRLTEAKIECRFEKRCDLIVLHFRDVEVGDLDRIAGRIEFTQLELRAIAAGQREDARITFASGKIGAAEIFERIEAK